jgi:Fe-S-cluster containining protein
MGDIRYMKKNKLRRRRKIKESSLLKKLLRQFKNLRREILKDRECSKCGICCNTFKIKLTQKDLDIEPKLIKNSIPLPKETIMTHKIKSGIKYIRTLKTEGKDNSRCVFYNQDKGCQIHSTKPAECAAYIPSFGHCKETEIKEYCNLTKYYNRHQKIFIEGMKKCGEIEKIESLIKVIDAFVAPFVIKLHRVEESKKLVVDIDYKKPIPLFIKKCLELDDNYKLVEDLSFTENTIKNLFHKSRKEQIRDIR